MHTSSENQYPPDYPFTDRVGHDRYPFILEVYVQRRPHMRDESLEMELYMGLSVLKNCFDDEVVDTKTTEVFFSYPERWMNIIEERSLYGRLVRLYPNLKKVRIKTQSVYIIQSTPAGRIAIVSSEDEQAMISLNGGLSQEAKEGRLWYANVGNVINANSLNVLGGSKS